MKIVRVGMIGAGFMCKLHSIAFATHPMYFWPVGAKPELSLVADMNEESAKTAAARFGYKNYTTDWKELVKSPDVDLVDIITPNDSHKEMAIAAINNGKNVYCEKPLALSAKDAKEMYDLAQAKGIVHAIGYNNRSIPAVLMAKKIIDEGLIGDVYSYRSQYMQDYANNPDVGMEWRYDAKVAGTGVLGDLSSHAIDLSRFLIGDITKVVGSWKRVFNERPFGTATVMGGKMDKILGYTKVDTDDTCQFICEYKNGALGHFQSSRISNGHKNTLDFELYGSKGALRFTNDRMLELEYYNGSDPADNRGFKVIKIGPDHPQGKAFWPVAGMGLGYADIKCSDFSFLMDAIAANDPSKVAASFYDGYKAEQVVDAVIESIKSNQWVNIAD